MVPRPPHRRVPGIALLALACALAAWSARAQGAADPPWAPGELKKLSLEELLDVKVTSVSKRPERLSESAAAIQVISDQQIRRSGATSLPEALRLAANLQVAQVNAHDWAITARGFNGAPLSNNSLANKLLVMIDGRTVYTPLFGGVFWDVQHVVLEDVDRIEVISGPGGTLWGANAVNGVINVVTKDASRSGGLYASGTVGTFLENSATVRYGDSAGDDLHLRGYVQHQERGSTELSGGGDAMDDWHLTQGGFRMDYDPSAPHTFTVQGDVYGGREGVHTANDVKGHNLLGRWTRAFPDESDLSLQVYVDHTFRRLAGAGFEEKLWTYDLDLQHRLPTRGRHTITWGGGYRLVQDDVSSSLVLSFFPPRRDMELYGAWLQDEIRLPGERLKLAVGTKLEHNEFSGFEVQPSARLLWLVTERQSMWAAVSWAVHPPSRFETETLTASIAGDPDFESEKVTAYELGYRARPLARLSLSVAGFYNDYADLRSINTNPAPPPDLVFANAQKARSWGVELFWNSRPADWWQVRGGATYLWEDISTTDPAALAASEGFEAIDPDSQLLVHSMMDLPAGVQLDVVARAVDALPPTALTPRIPGYVALDARLARRAGNWELAVVGRNLAEDAHQEFGTHAIPRAVYGQLTWRREPFNGGRARR